MSYFCRGGIVLPNMKDHLKGIKKPFICEKS